ncbi:endonuclease/exonuclease/phosphatase family protein [Tamlana sp. 2201CG12-4]|uniref:endonuclease/exonuclease/phosphatase family protein n=1 Tax=Tamlana sp. 2201CG12-4 TaxID=3112582 RepID=UPI002DBC519A|nr:endonuclease/exonuclease/phosphatase family protein [Tamlana sp. 2201CG12-4]MEC3906039.1 endonuclease/exonuclease/phosphatase family protein [Tamlana sp. 2201CG12-4]
MFKIIKLFLLLLNAIIILALLVIHFGIKESSYSTSLLFYTFPLPAIILIVLLLSVFLSRTFRRYNFFIAGVLLIIWLSRSFQIRVAEDIKDADLDIVFWNASHYRDFEDVFDKNIKIPDVVVLVEYHGDFLDDAQAKYPDFYFYNFRDKEIGLFSKTPIHIKKATPSKYGSTIINFETQGLNFYAVDVSGSIDVPRSWELEFVDKIITQTKNTIVLGDFNVPFESKLLNPIKTNFSHAFTEKGNGFRETWFWNIPLLSLDHIWVSRDLKILKTQKTCTFKSDHSMLKTIIRK